MVGQMELYFSQYYINLEFVLLNNYSSLISLPALCVYYYCLHSMHTIAMFFIYKKDIYGMFHVCAQLRHIHAEHAVANNGYDMRLLVPSLYDATI